MIRNGNLYGGWVKAKYYTLLARGRGWLEMVNCMGDESKQNSLPY